MKQQSTERLMESRPSWEDVEALARQRIQTWFQRLLEEEVEELLGRARYTRRDEVAPFIDNRSTPSPHLSCTSHLNRNESE